MARKTKRQKEISDIRNFYKFQTKAIYSPTVAKPTETFAIESGELKKTLILTLTILAFQILFFLSLKNHIIIPGTSY